MVHIEFQGCRLHRKAARLIPVEDECIHFTKLHAEWNTAVDICNSTSFLHCGRTPAWYRGGHNSLDPGSLCEHGITAVGAKCLMGAPKYLNNFTSTFFNAVNFLAKDLTFEHGSAKLASCPGRRLTSLRPWWHYFSTVLLPGSSMMRRCIFMTI